LSLAAVTSGSYNRFRQQRSGSIFGTVISQARNDFGDDNFIDRTLNGTILTAYNGQKMAGTRGA